MSTWDVVTTTSHHVGSISSTLSSILPIYSPSFSHRRMVVKNLGCNGM